MADAQQEQRIAQVVGTFPLLYRALCLVWSVAPGYTAVAAALTLVAAVTPAAQAWVLKLIVDALPAEIDPEVPFYDCHA